MEIGSILRESRVNAKMSVEQVSKILTKYGYRASQKTVYSWENWNSRPDIEILMRLCDIYGIKDILKTFGYDGYREDGSIQLNMREIDMVEKYRLIKKHSPDGASVVDTVFEREYSIAKKLKEQDEKIQKMNMEASEELLPDRIYTYFGRIACAGSGFYFDEIPTETMAAPDMGGDFIIGVNGDSMEPDYHDGDLLYVKKTECISHGDVGIFTIGNECFLKEYGENGLLSRNRDYDDIPGTEDVRLIGKVIGRVE